MNYSNSRISDTALTLGEYLHLGAPEVSGYVQEDFPEALLERKVLLQNEPNVKKVIAEVCQRIEASKSERLFGHEKMLQK